MRRGQRRIVSFLSSNRLQTVEFLSPVTFEILSSLCNRDRWTARCPEELSDPVLSLAWNDISTAYKSHLYLSGSIVTALTIEPSDAKAAVQSALRFLVGRNLIHQLPVFEAILEAAYLKILGIPSKTKHDPKIHGPWPEFGSRRYLVAESGDFLLTEPLCDGLRSFSSGVSACENIAIAAALSCSVVGIKSAVAADQFCRKVFPSYSSTQNHDKLFVFDADETRKAQGAIERILKDGGAMVFDAAVPRAVILGFVLDVGDDLYLRSELGGSREPRQSVLDKIKIPRWMRKQT